MRFLGIGDYCDLGAMYYGLAAAGHDVRVFIARPDCADVYGGLLQTTTDWRAELDWVRQAGSEGIVLFESATHGETQDALRRDGFQVIGGSAFGDRLEADRALGQQLLNELGLRIAPSHHFTDFATAAAFVEQRPRRYVFKSNGADTARTRNYIGELDSGADMRSLLTLYARQQAAGDRCDFVLMDHVDGVEVGVGAYFNGERFMKPVCIDWEHKRFFTGGHGELTGEMGTVVSYRGAGAIFDASLARVAPQLRQGGYCGYINLNLIANEHGLWPLEFTARFGYPGFAICEALHLEPWDAIFRRMLARDSDDFATRDGFACGVVLTVPPFPYSHGYEQLAKGAPICFRDDTQPADRAALHFAEVALDGAQLVASGSCGYIGVATGTGADVRDACDAAYRVARKVVVPNLRYRTDIGERVHSHDLQHLRALGWLDAAAHP